MLITLAIIGIIAALTVPTLMNKIQDHGFRSAFLKNYALIQNAYKNSINDGIPFLGEVPPPKADLVINPIYKNDLNLIKDYFKIQKGPYYNGNGAGIFTFQKFYSPSLSRNNAFKRLDGSYVEGFLGNGSAFTFQLTDGTIISFCMWHGYAYNIFIDVNGAKGPNTYGRDVYWMQAAWDRTLNRHIIHPMGDKYTGNNTHVGDGLVYDELGNTCTLKSSGLGCAYQIIKDRSFKIPKE